MASANSRAAVLVSLVADWDGKDLARAQREIAAMQKNLQTTSDKFSAMGDSVKNVGDKMTGAGKSMTLGITVPLAAIGYAAVNTASQFEVTMNSLQVNAQASGEQMKSLSGLAMQLGRDTVYSANEAAGAMLELSKGGLSPAAIQAGALKSTLALASTEGIDLSRAAVIVAQSMNTFGIKAKDTGKVVDLLAAGAVASTASVEDLSAGLKYVGSTAATLKVPMADTVTALAALNNAGLDSTTAGTSLNRFMLGLIPMTDKAGRAMDALGVSFTNSKGQILPMQEVIGRLREAVSGLGDDQKQAYLKAIFGVEGMRAANILLSQNVDGYNNLRDAVTKQGVAQEMANARMSGTAGALEQMKGSIDTALLAIGNALAPLVTTITGFVKQWVDWFQALDPAIQQVAVVVGILAAAMGPLLIVTGMLVSAAGTLIGALGAVTAPVLAVVAAIGLAVGAVVLLWTKSEAFRDGVMAVWEAVKTAIQGAIDNVKAKLAEHNDTVQTVVKAFQAVWDFINTYIIPILSVLVQQYFSALITVLGNVIGWLMDVVAAYVKFYQAVFTAGQKIVEFVQGVIKWFGDMWTFVSTTFDKIVGAVTGLPDRIAKAAEGMWDGIVNGFKSALNVIIDGWNRLSFTVPSVDAGPVHFGGQTIGVPKIPRLAAGGIVTAPTIAMIGEAGPEAIVPLSRGGGTSIMGGNTYNINVSTGVGDPRMIGQEIVQYVKRFEAANGPVWTAA